MHSKIKTFLLAFFFGAVGAHRFYTGKCWSGVIWILTGGVFGIGTLVDMTTIATNRYLDVNGELLANDGYSTLCWVLTILAYLCYLATLLSLIFAIVALSGILAASV